MVRSKLLLLILFLALYLLVVVISYYVQGIDHSSLYKLQVNSKQLKKPRGKIKGRQGITSHFDSALLESTMSECILYKKIIVNLVNLLYLEILLLMPNIKQIFLTTCKCIIKIFENLSFADFLPMLANKFPII
jgi:hypothetical protein